MLGRRAFAWRRTPLTAKRRFIRKCVKVLQRRDEERSVTMTTGMRTVVLVLLLSALAQAESPIPKELEGWQAWVQDGLEFQRCPFFANTDSTRESDRICAWP